MRNGGSTCAANKPVFEYTGVTDSAGQRVTAEQWEFPVLKNVVFIKNDTKVGALERAKFHFREDSSSGETVFVLEAFDKTKPIKFAEFFKAMHNPPEDQLMLASELIERERVASGVGKAVNVMKLSGKLTNSWGSQKVYTWEAIGDVAGMDKTKTYYYIPLTGFTLKSNYGFTGNGQNLLDMMQRTGLPGISDIELYGVRKGDMEAIEAMPNWKNVEQHINDTLSNIPQNIVMGIVKAKVSTYNYMKYTPRVYANMNPKSPLRIMYDEFKSVKDVTVNESAVRNLLDYYAKGSKFDVNVYNDKYTADSNIIHGRYPMLKLLSPYNDNNSLDVAVYINLVEKSLGN
jgi:hypothetical protein